MTVRTLFSQVNHTLHVQCVLQRKFEAKEWEALDGMLDSWLGKIEQLRGLQSKMGKQQLVN